MDELVSIAKKIKQINKKCYVVGGYCRDMILGVSRVSDIDLCTDALPDEIKSVLNVISEVGSKYGTFIIKEGNEIFEITTFRKDIGSINYRKPVKVEFTDSLHEDSLRRDFTINAIYYDILEDSFIDPVGGIDDLKNGIISFVGNIEDRLEEDVLRILRYVRFKNVLGLGPNDPNYSIIIKSKVKLLKNIAIERIKQELDKILISNGNINSLKELKEIGFLKIFLEDVDNLESTPGGPRWHLEGNVWIHTLMSIDILNKKKLFAMGYKKDNVIDLYWSVLLHDIGKKGTYSVDSNEYIHYYGHEKLSAKMFKENISKKIIFSTKTKKKIYWLLSHHLKILMISKMRKIKGYHLMMHEYFEELLLLGEADHLGRIPSDTGILNELKQKYKDFKEKIKNVNFYNGNDIKRMYPELQGEEIGKRIKELNNNLLSRL